MLGKIRNKNSLLADKEDCYACQGTHHCVRSKDECEQHCRHDPDCTEIVDWLYSNTVKTSSAVKISLDLTLLALVPVWY